jgi:hypothetical protein
MQATRRVAKSFRVPVLASEPTPALIEVNVLAHTGDIMKSETHSMSATTRKQGCVNALRSGFAALVVGCAFYAQDSSAVLLLENDTTTVEWYVGQPEPSMSMTIDGFVVVACGRELAWVYEQFPTIATRSIAAPTTQKRAQSVAVPADNVCVIWRGDNAMFIADNLTIIGR